MSVFSPTPAETALVNQIFAQSDPQKLGVITGDVAVRVFGGAKLPPTVLGEIWNIADEDNKGWLSKKGVSVAVRLIGLAQKGEKITPASVNKPGPLANIEGVALVPNSTGSSLPRSPAPGVPQLTPQDKAKYDSLFQRSGPVNGLLSADKARNIFVKSNLSNDQLLQIWNLADTKDRGALDSADFAIGMYMIQNVMSGKIPFIPSTLPPGLYQQAAGAVATHSTGTSGSFSPTQSAFAPSRAPLHAQYTGQQSLQPDHTGMSNQSRQAPRLPNRPNPAAVGSSAFGASPFGTPLNGNVQPQWDVTPAEKANADRLFDTLDTQRMGYIDGDVAVPFMLQSNLPGDDLAIVWDLCDINGDGRLTRDCFAVAMHLIQQKLAGHDIPNALPLSLVPPSMRNNANMSSPSSSFQQPAAEPIRDLLWDDSPPPPPSAPLPQQSTGVPQHLTGQTAGTPQNVFASPPQASRSPPSNAGPFGSGSKNFLDDDDTAHAQPLHDHSAEIGNVRNQLDSTTRSLDSTKAERANLEQTIANQAAELSSMQSQLAVTKASYDHETKLLQSLRERFAAQAAEIQSSKEELIRAESDLSAVKLEKAELEGSILRDKEEARGLNRRMHESTKEIELLKFDIEKAKKEAKQQKGLLAIAKKQLSTKETEKAKVEKELEEATAEVNVVTKEREDVEAELAKATELPLPVSPPQRADSVSFAAAQPLPSTPDVGSPSGSVKSNNPFDRLTFGSGSRSQSPFMPFANAAIPTPPVNGNSSQADSKEMSNDDPFGLNQPFEPVQSVMQGSPKPPTETCDVVSPIGETTLNGPNATSPEPAKDPLSASAESDFFATPPTTAASQVAAPAPTEQAPPRSTTLDEISAKFPDIDDSIPGAFPVSSPTAPANIAPTKAKRESTDLNHQLQDLDVHESDSDSDTDEDEVPLAELKKRASTEISAAQPAESGTNGTSNGHTTSFEDVFGLSAGAPPAANIAKTNDSTETPTKEASTPKAASPATDPFGFPTMTAAPVLPPPVAGVDAFDAAMSGISPSAPSAAPQFSFDDTFDFAAATASKQLPASNQSSNATANGVWKNGFDDVFGFPSSSPAVPAATPSAPPTDNTEPSKPSFDSIFATGPQPSQPSVPPTTNPSTLTQNTSSFVDTFTGFDSTPSLQFDQSFTAPGSQAPAAGASPPTSPKPFPTVSAPTSPERPLTAPGPVSPPQRSKSPPPRVASPKPRPSTSSKDGNEKPKEPPHRHSKLSIRLPFGKKKKQEAPPPPPAQFLTPPIEEPGSATPAVEDDVQQVKQLCTMGFSRTQAIDALERHSYDLPKALNSLLGSQ
ncbi:hypothetical protein BDN71DRAFT_1451789 [Pleurotus eryngii]|uniref:Uncharacterized protein n=1 Tax=Pleurotus eryngii TaxID=5323 RepID=A0A9P6DCY5_PLEER|nr:hypothetical protein BDN71DRAFT_1451789 [Pleurotus eryngii]